MLQNIFSRTILDGAGLFEACMENNLVRSGLKLLTVTSRNMRMFNEDAVADVVTPINKLVSLVLTAFAALGIILIAFGVFNFVTALDGHDTSQKIRAGLTIAGGILLCSIRIIIGFLEIPGIDMSNY